MASDHCPLFIDCTAHSNIAKRFHFERYWPKLDGYLDVVAEAWNSIHPDPDPFRRIYARHKATARRLRSWGTRTLTDISLQLIVARELVARLDEAQDRRPLTPSKVRLHRRLKCTYLGLASLERTITRQHSRFSWLRNGKISSAFLRLQASQRLHKTKILGLQCNGQLISDDEAMAEAAFSHFS